MRRFLGFMRMPTFALIMLTCCTILVISGAGWYMMLPEPGQREISRLTLNLMDPDKKVGFTDWAGDISAIVFGNRYISLPESFTDTVRSLYYPLSFDYPYPLTVLENESYATGYCEAYQNPAWVCYEMKDQNGKTYPESRPPFRADPRMSRQSLPSDYSGSGYDRGHLAPNYGIARSYGVRGQRETFLMTNIVPQTHELNAGVWKELESDVALNYAARFGTVMVVTGPVYYAKPTQKIKSKLTIPDAFFKIVSVQTFCGMTAYAYLIPQMPESRSPSAYLTTIDAIEKLTGLDFFPRFPESVQIPLESNSHR